MICGMERNPTLNMLGYVGVACANIPDSERQKLNKKARKICFVGYSKNSKGYRLYDEWEA